MRRFLVPVVIAAVVMFNAMTVNAEGQKANASFDETKVSSGVIKVACNAEGEKIKVLVEKDGKRYQYNLQNDGTVESFPLQMGNGEYKISVLENIGGDKYQFVSTENVSLKLADQKDVYLNSVQNINWDEDSAAVKKAKELTKDLKDDKEKINVIYDYVVSSFSYDYAKLATLKNDYLPDIDSMFDSSKGICYDYSSAFAAMLRSAGISAKLVKGYSENVKGYHAWNEVYNKESKKWMIIDTTFDSQMKAAKKKYSMEKESSRYEKVNEY